MLVLEICQLVNIVKYYVKKFYYRLKILDPIFENDNYEELLNYFNSLKFVNKNNSKWAR